MINDCLKRTTPKIVKDIVQYQHFILDGTFLQRPSCIVALMDTRTRMIVAGQYGISENSPSQLEKFFEPLIVAGLHPHSFTVDGHPKVIKTIGQLWPQVVVQRCLVHIQRQGLSWCRTSPKTTYARKLRKIFLQITKIRTSVDRTQFLSSVANWESRYGSLISSRRETGYVFSDIKRARSMLLRALPDMFHYLDNPMIPISTNGLEGYFS